MARQAGGGPLRPLPSAESAGARAACAAQAKDTQDEKRHTGGDTFAVRVVSADGKLEGSAHVVDLNNGQYKVGYSAPMAGTYQVSYKLPVQ